MAEPTGNRPPTLRDQQRIFTRARLIESAIQCFGEQGYHATKIEDIVAAAGASRATFYLHFNSKLEVLTRRWPRSGRRPSAATASSTRSSPARRRHAQGAGRVAGQLGRLLGGARGG